MTTTLYKLLDNRLTRWALIIILNQHLKIRKSNVLSIKYNNGLWISKTCFGSMVFPDIRLMIEDFDKLFDKTFSYKYMPQMGDVVFDIGAGIGEETLFLSRLVGDKGKVYAIEAVDSTYRCLKEMVSQNELKNVETIKLAVNDTKGQLLIEDTGVNIVNSVNTTTGTLVEADTIDNLLGKLNVSEIDFVKMNIEGSEKYALLGMEKSFSMMKNICVSCHDFLANKIGDDFFRTSQFVEQKLLDHFEIVEQRKEAKDTWIRDQLWASVPKKKN